jgi:regulatory protein
MRLAARSEKSSGDALRLMQSWGVEPSARQGVLQKLIDNKFIDDHRYAEAFVRDKMRFSGWGAFKLRAALRNKGISADIIEEVLHSLNSSDMVDRLH